MTKYSSSGSSDERTSLSVAVTVNEEEDNLFSSAVPFIQCGFAVNTLITLIKKTIYFGNA